MCRRSIIYLLVLLTVAGGAAYGQEADTASHGRKVVRMVTPVYPELARRMQMSGVVKLRATVAPNGSVKSIQPVGGHPLLIRAAQDAVTNWKFVAAPDETQEVIELNFKTR